MKRMNHIRNTLEMHNPKEHAQKIRSDAAKRRDERILELWRKD